MALIDRIEKYKTLYSYLAIFSFFFVNNTINATTVWMEHSRSEKPTISMWEPFVWEYTSAVSILILLPFLFYMFRTFPPKAIEIKRQILVQLIGTFLFSVSHVLLMVVLRDAIYQLDGAGYHFGPWLREFFYEYRKDAWAYILLFMGFHVVRALYARIIGEANPIPDSEENLAMDSVPERFLIKKLDKEFLIKTADIEWLESSGNYVNLHCKGRIYPYRSTLAELTNRLSSVGFSRIHRSYAVCHNSIEHISYLPSGDGEIKLKSGHVLKLSRNYKDAFKRVLG